MTEVSCVSRSNRAVSYADWNTVESRVTNPGERHAEVGAGGHRENDRPVPRSRSGENQVWVVPQLHLQSGHVTAHSSVVM